MDDLLQIATGRFGVVEVSRDTIFEFPRGLLGLEERRQWCVLHHEELEHLAWLQSIDDPELALLLVNPDELFSDYVVQLEPPDLEPLELSEAQAHSTSPPVIMRVVIRPMERSPNFVVNVRAPILFNLDNRKGMQVSLARGALPDHYRGPVELSVSTEAPVSM